MCEVPKIRMCGMPHETMSQVEDKLKTETMPETLAVMLAQAMKGTRELRGVIKDLEKRLETIRGELKAAKDSSTNYYDIWRKGAKRVEVLSTEVSELKLELKMIKRKKKPTKKAEKKLQKK